jgi:hypothetical protein
LGLEGEYPEANYSPNLDIYNGETSGFEVDGKRLKGFKAAFGPTGGEPIQQSY